MQWQIPKIALPPQDHSIKQLKVTWLYIVRKPTQLSLLRCIQLYLIKIFLANSLGIIGKKSADLEQIALFSFLFLHKGHSVSSGLVVMCFWTLWPNALTKKNKQIKQFVQGI